MAQLTVKQAAEKYTVSRAMVYLWVDERRFPVLRVGAIGKRGRILIDQADFETFLAGLRIEAGTAVSSGPLKHITQ